MESNDSATEPCFLQTSNTNKIYEIGDDLKIIDYDG